MPPKERKEAGRNDRAPAHRRGRRRDVSRRNGVRTRTLAAGAILAVWAISTVADIWSSSYSPPEGVNTLALAAATYLFGSAFLKERD